MKSAHSEPLLVTPREAARLLGIGRAAVYALLANNALPIVAVGRRKKISRAQLQDWVAAQSSWTAPPRVVSTSRHSR